MLYIDDVVNMFDNAIESKLYADDLKLYCEIFVTEADWLLLQDGFDNLVSWSNKWQLSSLNKNAFLCKLAGPIQFPTLTTLCVIAYCQI